MKMKKVTLLLTALVVLFSTASSFAQGMGGSGSMMGGRQGGGSQQGRGQGMPPQQQQQQRSIEIDFLGAAGYFDIDTEMVIKKMKIKNDKPKVDAIVDILSTYNTTLAALIAEHRTDIDVLEFAKDNIDALDNSDMEQMRSIMMQVNQAGSKLKPIMLEVHLGLNNQITELLNPKELKKWEKIYENICDDNSFQIGSLLDAPGEGERGERGERGDGERPSGPPPGR